MKKFLRMFVATAIAFAATLGVSQPAFASSWSSAKGVWLDTTFSARKDTNDLYDLMDAAYFDTYRFTVPAKGTITIVAKCKTTDDPPFVGVVKTSNTDNYLLNGGTWNATSHDWSSSYRGYYTKWKVTLAKGTYYLRTSYPYYVDVNTNYSMTLQYRPSFSNTRITSKAGKSKAITVKWARAQAATGYQVQYSVYSNMKKAKTFTVKGNTKLSKTITGLKSGKKYYVRVRTYKKVKVNGVTKTFYGKWTAKGAVKTK